MTRHEIEQKILFEASRILGGSKIGLDDPFHKMGMDSLALIELMLFVETEFDLKLFDSDLDKEDLETVRILAGTIYERLK